MDEEKVTARVFPVIIQAIKITQPSGRRAESMGKLCIASRMLDVRLTGFRKTGAITSNKCNIGLNLPRIGEKVLKKWLLCVGLLTHFKFGAVCPR